MKWNPRKVENWFGNLAVWQLERHKTKLGYSFLLFSLLINEVFAIKNILFWTPVRHLLDRATQRQLTKVRRHNVLHAIAVRLDIDIKIGVTARPQGSVSGLGLDDDRNEVRLCLPEKVSKDCPANKTLLYLLYLD